jgi:hypothetical protein
MKVLLVVGLLFDVLLILGAVALGVAFLVSFGAPWLEDHPKRCPACGEQALMRVEPARQDGRLRILQCTKCGSAFVVGLDGSYTAYPPTGSQPS